MTYDVVVPTVGRPSLQKMLEGLAAGDGPLPEKVVIVDDRRAAGDLSLDVPTSLEGRVVVVRSHGRGPAAARNLGARHGRAEWIEFLDDDVAPPAGWRQALARDIDAAGGAAATQGNVHGFEGAVWITADMAYRREAFVRAGGFDERFPRAYREDSDLGLRVVRCGGTIVQGERWAHHPPTAVNGWASVRKQRGNADDALMLLLHGPGWHERAGAPRGTRRRHLVTTALFASGVLAAALGRRRPAFVAGAAWGALTARLAVERREVASSVAIPFAATWWWLAGLARAWRLTRPPRAVLFDRDGTLVEDVPYNGDPTAVMPVPGARAALDRLRGAGVRVAMVTNQSGVARGFITEEQVRAVNGQVEQLLGPFDATLACMHGPDDDCACRKPRPGLVIEAATRLGVRPADCVVIGDIEADVMAAQSAGARGVLVPNAATLADEVTRAKEVAFDLQQAVDRLLARST